MANIQPFDYQKSTNIEEHNQIVNKVNEIVQVINDVNLDTINSEIANLKANATATDTEIANIKNKDSAQDTEIDGITKSLVSNVSATFDNPSRTLMISVEREASPPIDATVVIPASSETGQYSAGNGITIQDYQIAVDTNVVALKTDIPVVPDVTEINNRLDTVDSEISGITSDITDINNKNTEQDTAIAGKVAISQGVENAGKSLVVGDDGNVTLGNGGSAGGGEVWEEVDLANIPTDWGNIERIKVCSKFNFTYHSPSSWTTKPSMPTVANRPGGAGAIIEMSIVNTPSLIPVYVTASGNFMHLETIQVKDITQLQIGNLFESYGMTFNGGGVSTNNLIITKNNAQNYLNKLWIKRKS